jgi:hypothetical protein
MAAARPLLHRKRKSIRDLTMSQKCQSRPNAPQQEGLLFDRLVSAGEHRRRHVQAEPLRGFEVDDQFVLGRRLHGKVGGLPALEDLAGIDAGPTLCFREVVDQSGSSVVPQFEFFR